MAQGTVGHMAGSSHCETGGACGACALATLVSLRTDFRVTPVKEAMVQEEPRSPQEEPRCPPLPGCASYQYKVPLY